MTKAVVLSPHFDDAVFSCWKLLIKPDSEVITVFGGSPPVGTKKIWDKVCGISDSHLMMKTRKTENTKALSLINVKVTNLEYLENQYRVNEIDINKVVDKILGITEPNNHYYVPIALSGIYQHPDHILIRQVGLELLKRGHKVSFYADIPYMKIPSNDLDKYKTNISLKAKEVMGIDIEVQVNELDKEEQSFKSEAMKIYKSQFKMTNITSFGRLNSRQVLSREILFNVK